MRRPDGVRGDQRILSTLRVLTKSFLGDDAVVSTESSGEGPRRHAIEQVSSFAGKGEEDTGQGPLGALLLDDDLLEPRALAPNGFALVRGPVSYTHLTLPTKA